MVVGGAGVGVGMARHLKKCENIFWVGTINATYTNLNPFSAYFLLFSLNFTIYFLKKRFFIPIGVNYGIPKNLLGEVLYYINLYSPYLYVKTS